MHASQAYVIRVIINALREIATNFGGNGIRTDRQINQMLNELAAKLEEALEE